ncbi:1014_t:CDS:2, partial [Acaulospora colombiana]
MQRERLIKEKRTRIKRKVDLRSLEFFDKSTTNEGNEIMNLYDDGNPKKKLKGTAEVTNTTLPQVQVQFNSNSDDFFYVDNESEEASAETQESTSTTVDDYGPKTPPLRHRQVTVTTPAKPILYKHTMQHLAKHFSVHAIQSVHREYSFDWIEVQASCIRDIKELFPEFDFTLNKVDGIGSKVSSNKEIVFIEVSGGPENAVLKHVKEDTEKLIKEAMF